MASLKSAVPPRKWTEAEDQTLQHEAEIQLKRGSISDWKTIASKISGRSNKDCRKRWSKIGNSIVKGPWEVGEDERLQQAVAVHGFRWSQVSEQVRTRNADQCVKRWSHSLDPNVDRSSWKPDEDKRLLDAVAECGRSWTTIAETRFQRRSTTDIKNRYAIIKRRLSQKKTAQAHPVYELGSENELELDSEADEGSLSEGANAPIGGHATFMDCDANFDTLDFSSPLALTSDGSFLGTTMPIQNVFPSNELYFDTSPSQVTTGVNSTSADSDVAAFSSMGTPFSVQNNQLDTGPFATSDIQGAPDGTRGEFFGAPPNTLPQNGEFSQGAMCASKENDSRVKSLTLTLEGVDSEGVNGIMKVALEMRSARVSMHVDQ
ncbi:MAG: hypothetical protein Q9157_001733 [Trypethelium eluteriae]